MNEFIKKEWRNLAWLIGIIVSGIFALRTAVSDVKAIKPKVEALELFKAGQDEKNKYFEKKLDSIESKIDRLLDRGR